MDHTGELESVVVGFPVPRERVPTATKFKTTWLSSSLRALRQRDLFGAYMENLPARHHAAVLGTVVGEWQPAELAIAHYEACDALGLPVSEQVAIGEEVTLRAQGGFLGTMLKLATRVGVTPWTLLAQSNRMWEKTWIGGGVAVYRLDEHRARVELVGWPCSGIGWCRHGMRGLLQAATRLFAERTLAQDVPALCTESTLGYTVSWVGRGG
jgi:hypothetical protein